MSVPAPPCSPLFAPDDMQAGASSSGAGSPTTFQERRRAYNKAIEKMRAHGDAAAEDNEHADAESISSCGTEAGVRGIEAVSQTWSSWSLLAAYIGIFLLAFATSLEAQTTTNLTAYATSAFAQHSLISTVAVIQGVVNAVIKPPISKIANVFGRLEAFSFSILLYVCGSIQMAASQDVQTFASAQIFYAAGSQGLQMLQQIFIADTSNLLTRALFSSLPDTPFLVTIWIGPPLAQKFLSGLSWRWGYGIWAIVLPIAFLPLALSLIVSLRTAAKKGLLPKRPWSGYNSAWTVIRTIWSDLDAFGLLILCAAIALVLVPLTLTAKANGGWHNPSIVAMITIGCLCWVAFPAWELNPRYSRHPFLSLRTLKNRNVILGCAIGFFYFGVFYLSLQPYFFSYLQVVQFEDVTTAGQVTQSFSFTATVTAVIISLVIWRVKYFKQFIVAGAAIYIAGVGLMIRYRVQGSSTGQLVGAQIALGIGGGMINVPVQLAVQAAVPHTDVAAATALFLTFLEIGGAVGSAISGAIWTSNLPSKLTRYLPEVSKDLAPQIYANLTLAQTFPANTPIRDAINRSYQETMDLLLKAALCFAALTFILSFGLKNVRLDEAHQHVKGRVIGGDPERDNSTEETRDDL